MKLKEIAAVLNATTSCGADKLEEEVEMGYSSDLMSDVLTLDYRDGESSGDTNSGNG